jgi:hypothetical protein
MPKLIALHVVLDKTNLLPQVKAPTESEPAADVRLGFAEGLARRGEIDRARAVAQLPGRIEDRFAAQVLVAANIDAAAANPDFDACVSILEKDWGSRDLPDWSLIRLSQAIGRARATSVGARLFAWLQSQSPSGPHSQAVRAWAQYELLRNDADAYRRQRVRLGSVRTLFGSERSSAGDTRAMPAGDSRAHTRHRRNRARTLGLAKKVIDEQPGILT